MAFEIEKEIPIPKIGRTMRNKPPIYPFEDMQINDSFAVQHLPDAQKKTLGRVRSAVAIATKKLGVRFTVRSMGDHVRVWRVA